VNIQKRNFKNFFKCVHFLSFLCSLFLTLYRSSSSSIHRPLFNITQNSFLELSLIVGSCFFAENFKKYFYIHKKNDEKGKKILMMMMMTALSRFMLRAFSFFMYIKKQLIIEYENCDFFSTFH
jgi:hypothetical protein